MVDAKDAIGKMSLADMCEEIEKTATRIASERNDLRCECDDLRARVELLESILDEHGIEYPPESMDLVLAQLNGQGTLF